MKPHPLFSILIVLALLCVGTQAVLAFDPAPNAQVEAIAIQADGKVVTGGYFIQIGEQSRINVARLHPDGSVDDSFVPALILNGGGSAPGVLSIVIQPDGKILIAGRFVSVGGLPRRGIARLNTNGTVDDTFNPVGSAWEYGYTVALQPDGKVLVGGRGGVNVGGVERAYLARYNADGSLDAGFDAAVSLTGSNGDVRALLLLPDGRILIGGWNTVFSGTTRRLARVHPDGSLDPTFDPNPNDSVFALTLQEDGKILVGGDFTQIAGISPNRMVRLNADGSIDPGYDTTPGAGVDHRVNSFSVQPDGRILVGGLFATVVTASGAAARQSLLRLEPDGLLDQDFDALLGPPGLRPVNATSLQDDGRILIGGQFMEIDGIERRYLARLHPDGTLDGDGPVLPPQIVVDPESLSVTISQGHTLALPLVLSNAGDETLTWTIEPTTRTITHARGGVTEHLDLNGFEQAAGPIVSENFQGGPTPPGVVRICEGEFNNQTNNQCFSPGNLVPGFSAYAGAGSGNLNINVIGAGQFQVPVTTIGPSATTRSTQFDFDPPVQAVAVEVFRRMNAGVVNIILHDVDGDELGSSSVMAGTSTAGFIGFTSDVPIAGMSVDAAQSNEHELIGMLYFSEPPAVESCDAELSSWLAVTPNAGSVDSGESSMVSVSFETGTLSLVECIAELRIQSNDPNRPEVLVPVTLNVVDTPQSTLLVTPAQVDFGTVEIGKTSDPRTVNLTSIGDASVTIDVIDAAEAPFGRVGGDCPAPPFSLSPGESCSLEFEFSPTQAGSPTQTLAIESNSNANSAVVLTGQGGVPGPRLVASPAAVDFGEIEVGELALAQTVTLTSTGGVNITISNIAPATSPFARTGGSCSGTPFTLTPGQNCTLIYRFGPIAAGSFSQSLAVASNADPVSIELAGIGVETTVPQLTVTPSTLTFPPVAIGTPSIVRTATLASVGSAPATIDTIDEAQVPFARVGGSCLATPFTLAPTESCTLDFQFTPTEPDVAMQTLAIAGNAGPVSLLLAGLGLEVPVLEASPASVDFGEIEVGELAPDHTVTLTSTGSATVTVNTIGAASSPFERAGGTCSGTPFTLAPGENCTLIYRFGPVAAGSFSQSIAVTSNASALSIELAGAGIQTILPPQIEIDPEQVAIEVEAGDSASETLLIGNVGEADLEWSLRVDALAGPTGMLRAIGSGTVFDSPIDLDGVDFAALGRSPAGAATVVHDPEALPRGETTTVTHSNVPDQIAAPNTVACGIQGQPFTRGNQFLRSFTLTDFGIDTGFQVEEVRFGVEMLDVAQDITVNLYTLEGTFTYANLELLATATVSLAPQTTQFATVPISASVPAGATLVMELVAPDMDGIGRFYAGSNSLGETAPSYIASTACSINEPATYASISHPQVHLLMSVTGRAATECALPPWLDLDPASGTVAGNEVGEAEVTIDAADLSAGTHDAVLCIESNDPTRPLVTLPVSAEVTDNDTIFRHGFEGDGP